MGYSHLDVHTSHLQILARLEGFEPPPDRVETGRSNPLSYKRMAESRVIETQPFRIAWLSKPARPLTDLLSKFVCRFIQVSQPCLIDPIGAPKNLEQLGRIELHSLRLGRPRTRHALSCLVGVVRIKLTTSRLKAGCSNQLSYTPKKWHAWRDSNPHLTGS